MAASNTTLNSANSALVDITDVTAKTGIRVIGSVTSWQTKDGNTNVEHLAGRDANGNLQVFWRTPTTDWRSVNVTAKTGQKIAGAVTSWQTKDGNTNVEHLAGRDANGNLQVFWWTPATDWRSVNVTAKTGQKIAGPVTSWQTKDGNTNVEHLAGQDANGNLQVFWWTPKTDWRSVNVTAKTGQKIAGAVTSWQTKDGNTNVEHLAGQDANGNLQVFWWTPATDWRSVNVTAKTGEKISGAPTVYQVWDGSKNTEVLGARSPDNSLLMYWWKPDRDWQVLNLSDATGKKIVGAPENWNTANGNKPEHFAGIGENGNLLVFGSDAKPRNLTDGIGNPFQTLKRQTTPRDLLTILWDPHRAGVPAPKKTEVESLLYGKTNSVQDYFSENSNGNFTIKNAGVLGWYDANKPAEHYWGPADAGDKDGDGWVEGHVEKWTEAIRKADKDFNFAAYDRNSDGTVTPDELGILMVIPEAGNPGGFTRAVVGREFPAAEPLIVDGVKIGVNAIGADISEIYTGKSLELGVTAHELSHLLLNHTDMYFNFNNPFAAGDYSLMDNSHKTNHLDPIAKLKFGWTQPKVVLRSGDYNITDIETGHKAWILMDPRRGTDEYFIIENRQPGTSYDRQMPDSGLAVWHVMENPATAGSIPPVPAGTTKAAWEANWKSYGGDWGRRNIWMVKPVWNTFTNSQALWDSTDAATGYDLLSNNPDSSKASLRWADGTASGFSIRNIPKSAATMRVHIDVPDFQAPLTSTKSRSFSNGNRSQNLLTHSLDSKPESFSANPNHDLITGNRLNKVIVGQAGNDTLMGRNGNHRLAGKADFEGVKGGAGKTFVLNADRPFKAAQLGGDPIADFTKGKDKIVLDSAPFAGSKGLKFASVKNVSQAQNSEALITYVRSSGSLFYNANGSESGFGAGGQLASLTNKPVLTKSDILTQAIAQR